MREYFYFILSQSLLHFDYFFLLFNDSCCFLIVNAFLSSLSFFLIINSYEMLSDFLDILFSFLHAVHHLSMATAVKLSRNVLKYIQALFRSHDALPQA